MPKKKPVGNKSGPRGHWPKGKPRNEAVDGWPDLKRKINRLLRNPDRKGRSSRALARHCDVTDRSVRRWLSGEDVPAAEHVASMAMWLSQF